MIMLLLHLLRLLALLDCGDRQLALENLALRQQLAVYKRTVPRPKLRTADRFFWMALAWVWAGWRQPLVIVTPETVLRWRRRRFREYWTKLSGRPAVGRPPVHAQIMGPIDFFTVPTARLRVLFVFVVLAHLRGCVLHFNVTEHPTVALTAQQILDAF